MNIWESISSGVSVRDSTLINLVVERETQKENGKSKKEETENESEGNVEIIGNESERNAEFVKYDPRTIGNIRKFAYRWHHWKLLLGDIQGDIQTSSKSIFDPVNSTADSAVITISNISSESWAGAGPEQGLPVGLYNLVLDPGERDNLVLQLPALVDEILGKISTFLGELKLTEDRTTSMKGRSTGIWMPWLDAGVPIRFQHWGA